MKKQSQVTKKHYTNGRLDIKFNEKNYIPKEEKKYVKTEATEEQLNEISKHFVVNPKISSRNITNKRNEDWNKLEDTYLDSNKESFFVPLTTSNEDDGFEKPLRRKSNKVADDGFQVDVSESQVMSKQKIRLWRNANNIKILSKKRVECQPLLRWEGPLHEILCKSLVSAGYMEPTIVQSCFIPIILEKFNICGISKTGSGKTLAYVVPLLHHILNIINIDNSYNVQNGPIGLIVVPTYELANQVQIVINSIAFDLPIKSRSITAASRYDIDSIDGVKDSHIFIATPGKISELLSNYLLVLDKTSFIVLDEADKMMDPALRDQLDGIFSKLPKERQVVMFSATTATELSIYIEKFFNNICSIFIGDINDTSDNVKQSVRYFTNERDKKADFRDLLFKVKTPCMIFCNSKTKCEECYDFVSLSGFRTAMIHGGKTIQDRENVVAALDSGLIDYIVATDILSRGIDINGIRTVVNFELPTKITTYIHRIGRTGRGDDIDGVAISYVDKDDKYIMFDLINLLERKHVQIPDQMRNNPYSKEKIKYEDEGEILDI